MFMSNPPEITSKQDWSYFDPKACCLFKSYIHKITKKIAQEITQEITLQIYQKIAQNIDEKIFQ